MSRWSRRITPFLLGLFGVLWVGSGDFGREAASPTPLSNCTDACYQAKSVEYQRCRHIPATDRGARVACFQRADDALHRCLRNCH